MKSENSQLIGLVVGLSEERRPWPAFFTFETSVWRPVVIIGTANARPAYFDWNASSSGGLVGAIVRSGAALVMLFPTVLDRPQKKMRDNHRNYAAKRWSTLRSFVADQNAVTAIEYCLIATGIALGIFVAVAGIAARINAEFTAINGSLK
jgi:pilus assembly protein Flp/PilA